MRSPNEEKEAQRSISPASRLVRQGGLGWPGDREGADRDTNTTRTLTESQVAALAQRWGCWSGHESCLLALA